MKYNELLDTLSIFAETVKGEFLFDISSNINPNEFFKIKFEKEKVDQQNLSYHLYKSIN